MKAADLRAIATKGQPGDLRSKSPPAPPSPPSETLQRRRGVGDVLYYGLLGFCGLIVLSADGIALESPEARDARLAEETRQQRVRAVERQQAAIDDDRRAKEDAKLARLDACTVEIQAFAVSQDAVRVKLKAPSTASFPWTPIRAQHTGDCRFQVLAYVDAQNGFGAMIRSNYIATLTYAPDTNGWRLTSVRLENLDRGWRRIRASVQSFRPTNAARSTALLWLGVASDVVDHFQVGRLITHIRLI